MSEKTADLLIDAYGTNMYLMTIWNRDHSGVLFSLNFEDNTFQGDGSPSTANTCGIYKYSISQYRQIAIGLWKIALASEGETMSNVKQSENIRHEKRNEIGKGKILLLSPGSRNPWIRKEGISRGLIPKGLFKFSKVSKIRQLKIFLHRVYLYIKK